MNLTRDQIAELKRLAEQATPGGWVAYNPSTAPSMNPQQAWFLTGPQHISVYRSSGFRAEDAQFMAAFNPATASALLALAERALEPQGQALPVGMFVHDAAGFYHQVPPGVVKNYPDDPRTPLYASQLALPAGQDDAADDLRQHKDHDPSHPQYVAGFKAGHKAGRARALQAGPVPAMQRRPESDIAAVSDEGMTLDEALQRADEYESRNVVNTSFVVARTLRKALLDRTPAVAQPALSRQQAFDRFSFLEGVVNESYYRQIAETAISMLAEQSSAVAQPVADERDTYKRLLGVGDATIEHHARLGRYQIGSNEFFHYRNGFEQAIKIARVIAYDARAALGQPAEEGGKA